MLQPASAVDHACQTPYSDPGRWAPLLDAVEPTIAAVSAMVCNVIAHYRGRADELPEETRTDIDLRWVAAILDADQQRNGGPLTDERAVGARVQGCCRDHTLLSVATLRAHGVPARSRVGFASYLTNDDWHHDHVIVEAWLGDRWRRFDPEIPQPRPSLPDPTDIASGRGAPFETAAEVWLGHRRGDLDVDRYGVVEGLGLDGDWFVHGYVIAELAHRFGDELLLWDQWGAMTGDLPTAPPEHLDLVDEIARLSLRADGGDAAAEQELLARYRGDGRLHPTRRIRSFSPYGGHSEVDLGERPSEPSEPFEIGHEG